MERCVRFLVIIILNLLLIACGSGGNDSPSPTTSSLSSKSTSSYQASSSAPLITYLIEAEDYESYVDTTVPNDGGFYRNDSVDIAESSDAGGGYTVTAATEGEWLEYSVKLAPGYYNVVARVAADNPATYEVVYNNISIGFLNIAESKTNMLWHSQKVGELHVQSEIEATVKILVYKGSFNINWLKIEPVDVYKQRRQTSYMAYSKVNPGKIFNFEDVDLWDASEGIKALSAYHTKGEYALSIKNFTETVVESKKINSFVNMGDNLSFDLLVSGKQTGTLSLKINIPSRNILGLSLGEFNLADLTPDVFTTLSARIPVDISSISEIYHDLSFQFAINSDDKVEELIIDNMVFGSETSVSVDKVEIEVNGDTEFLHLIVNDVVLKVWRRGVLSGNAVNNVDNGRLDISHLFWQGANAVKIIGINGPFTNPIDVKMWVNGELVFEDYCPDFNIVPVCSSINREGVRHRYYLTLNTPNVPEAKRVEVTPQLEAGWGANLYIDDMFVTNVMPSILYLPEGQYKFGLGKYKDEALNYDASFYEVIKDIDDESLVDFIAESPLSVQNSFSIALLPIRAAYYSDTGATATLQDAEIEGYRQQIELIYDKMIKPFSYGLQDVQVDVLPTVEDVKLNTNAAQNFDPHAYLEEAGLEHIQDQYQIIIFAFSVYDNEGHRIDGSTGAGAWADGGFISINNATQWLPIEEGPHPVFLHEILHVYEQYQRDYYGFYNGTFGLHGSAQQRYLETSPLGELYWFGWYKDFMRNTVKENHTVREYFTPLAPPAEYDLHIGTFEVIRYGLGFLH